MLDIDKNTPCFFTQQVFLIGTYDQDGAHHFAPISWISYTGGEPSCLVISMNGTKKTKENVHRDGYLTATVVTPDMLPFCEYCNKATHKPELGSTMKVEVTPASTVHAPLLAHAKFSYECRVIHTVELGATHTYFAEIQKVNLSDDVKKLDFFDLREINPVIYSPYHYFAVGEHLGRIGDYTP